MGLLSKARTKTFPLLFSPIGTEDVRSLSKKLKTLAGSLGNISQKEGIVELQLQAGFDSELIADRICRTIPCIQVTTP